MQQKSKGPLANASGPFVYMDSCDLLLRIFLLQTEYLF